mgnify:CR=1 FL=1
MLMKVLIADDSRSMRKMVQATLEEAGYEVVVTEDGQQAWDALCKGDLRLAILDWVMPYMDGLEICRRLQKEKPLNMVQVILLTSTEGAENVAAALQAGASDYITKPFHPDELIARLKVGERIVNLQMQLSHAQKMEAIGSLASGIAHEINTPLQYVRDNVNFIQDAFRDMNKLLEKYSYLHKAADHNQITPPSFPASQGEDEDKMRISECGMLITPSFPASQGEDKGREKTPAGAEEVAEEEARVKYLMEEVPKAVQESLEGLGRIAEIVKAMKEFAPPGMQDRKIAVDVNKAITHTLTVSQNEWKNVADVVTNFDTALPLVPCFPIDFNLMVLNIIINATHAIADMVDDKKGGKGIINVSTRRCGDWAEIRISDTGAGIPEEIRHKIFDPFFTTKKIGRGTGMGLTMAYTIVVEKHGGTITFDTETGKGTTFIIRLPVFA